MRIRWGIAGLLLASLIVTSAEAYDVRTGISAVFGAGNSTCATMTDDVARYQAEREVYTAYIDGFLTAVNVSLPGKADFFLDTDRAARYKFVLQYCEANPLDFVVTAINTLVKRYKSDFPPP